VFARIWPLEGIFQCFICTRVKAGRSERVDAAVAFAVDVDPRILLGGPSSVDQGFCSFTDLIPQSQCGLRCFDGHVVPAGSSGTDVCQIRLPRFWFLLM